MQFRILALTGLMAVFAPQVSRLSAAVETPVPESHLRLFHTHTGAGNTSRPGWTS
jgi:uncharacterized protein YjeT (DUF2065 family)